MEASSIKITLSALLICGLGMAGLSGCTETKPDKLNTAIINLDTGESSYSHVQLYRRQVLDFDVPNNTYRTIEHEQREEEIAKNRITLKTFDSQAKVLEQKTLSIGHGAEYFKDIANHWLSPDHKKLMHVKDSSLNVELYALDIDTGNDKLVLKSGFNSENGIKNLTWLSNTKFIISLGNGHFEGEDEITIVDITDNSKKTIFKPTLLAAGGGSDILLSPNKQYLAFIDAEDAEDAHAGLSAKERRRILKVIDITTGQLLTKLGYSDPVVWNEDSTELAYQGEGHIFIWNKEKNAIREVVAYDTKPYLVFAGNNIVYTKNFAAADGSLKDIQLIVIDSHTKEQKKVIPMKFSGNIYYLQKSNSILMLNLLEVQ